MPYYDTANFQLKINFRVIRCASAKSASNLPKKRQLLNTAPKKARQSLKKKRQLVLFKAKKVPQTSSSHPD